MLVRPEIRYFIPCWKEPTMTGSVPTAPEILYAIHAKKGFVYPLWQRTFFTLALIANLHGECAFHLELRLEQLESEIVIQQTDLLGFDPGNDPLHVNSVSIMMKPAELPERGVYHVCLIWNDHELARATFHAR
jgi:hypothetical protein